MRWIIISLLVGVYAFETVVAILNQKYSRKPVPKNVQDVYNKKGYNKWLAYSLEGHKFGLLRQGFSLLILLALLMGPFAGFDRWVSLWTTNPILQSLLFLGSYQTLMVLLGIPFGMYRTFSIEERHGFNRTTKKVFIRDTIISYLVTLALGGLLVGGIHALFLRFADNLWMFVFLTWSILAVLMVLAVAVLGKWFMRLFNRFTPLPEGELRSRIEKLGAAVGFNVKAILVMDASKRSTKSNAAFMGIGKTREVILYDTLLEKMSGDEILAVLAHELGHAVHKDTWRLLARQVAVMGLYAVGIGLVLQAPALYTAFGFSGVHFGFATILFSILLEPISLLLGIPLNLLSRKAEYKADAFASEHTDASWLASALKTLSRENLSNLNPHPLSVRLYYSHPPMSDRIGALHRNGGR
ncbi:MAG TPA: M48 family metallopeptidase [Limnochordia bacterium]|nr:M48 family metallopeptidase [Limnochordia bacterium]